MCDEVHSPALFCTGDEPKSGLARDLADRLQYRKSEVTKKLQPENHAAGVERRAGADQFSQFIGETDYEYCI